MLNHFKSKMMACLYCTIVCLALVVFHSDGFSRNFPRSISLRMRISMKNPIDHVNGKLNHAVYLNRNNVVSSTRLHFKLSEDESEVEVDQSTIQFDEGFDGNSFLKKISRGIVPLAASVGFAVTPSPKVAYRIAGAAAGGVAGMIARKIIEDRIPTDFDDSDSSSGSGGAGTSLLSPAAVKTLQQLKNGKPIMSQTLKSIEQLAKRNNVESEDLGLLFTHIFAEAVYSAVIEDSMDLTELNDVVDFASSVGFAPSEIGDGFALAAIKIGRKVGRDARGFFAADYAPELFYQASKVFFLADKMVGSSEGYYGKRLSVALSFFTTDSYRETITEACKNLFKRCIESVLSDPDNFSAEEVDTLRAFLSTSTSASELRPANMQNMIMEAIQFNLDNALNNGEKGEQKVDLEKFAKIQKAFGWNSRELAATMEVKTMPLFEKEAKEIVDHVVDNPTLAGELAVKLEDRINSLGVDIRKGRVFLTTLISDINSDYMSKIDKVYNVSGGSTETAFKIMVTHSHTLEALDKLTKPVMDDIALPIPGLPFADMVRAQMYKMQLLNIKDPTSTLGKLSASVKSEMFSLSESQQASVRKIIALPKVTSWINQCISESNFNDGARAAYKKILDEFDVSEKEWHSTAVDFYYQEAEKIASARAIPTAEDMEKLKILKDFLDCPDSLVSQVNMELLGDKYVKALVESMTPTGVITEEYLDGLERLRVRLSLTKTDAEKLLGFAARNRITPIVKDLVDIWKSDTDANYRREKEKKEKSADKAPKDKSGDPISDPDNIFGYMELGGQKEGGGPNVFMREALNLVDFVVENYRVTGVDLKNMPATVSSETLAKEENAVMGADTKGEETDSSVPAVIPAIAKASEPSIRMPVTAFKSVPEEDLVGMYKHYLITRLSEQDPVLRERYIENEEVFGRLLGITPEGMKKLRTSLAFTAYESMTRGILRYKEGLDPQDVGQIAMLKESLDLDEEEADLVYMRAVRRAVRDHTDETFAANEESPITPDMTRRLRNQLLSFDLDIRKDVGFSDKLITYMYALEVQDLVDQGREEELQDVMEAYDIPEDRAADIVEACCKRYISQLLNLGLRAAKKYDEKEALQWMREIAKYSQFVTGTVDADGTLFDEEDKKRMISFYQTELESTQSSSEDAEKETSENELALREDENRIAEECDRLRDMINLTESFVPPTLGIAGLLGNAIGLNEMSMDSGKGKKQWAWN